MVAAMMAAIPSRVTPSHFSHFSRTQSLPQISTKSHNFPFFPQNSAKSYPFPKLVLTPTKNRLSPIALSPSPPPTELELIGLSSSPPPTEPEQDANFSEPEDGILLPQEEEKDYSTCRSIDLRATGVAEVKDQVGDRCLLYALATLFELLFFKFYHEKKVVSIVHLGKANKWNEYGTVASYFKWAYTRGILCAGDPRPYRVIESYSYFRPETPEEIFYLLDTYGPLLVISRTGDELSDYREGFYTGEPGFDSIDDILHAMVIVAAYRTSPGEGYVVIQNSASSKWGVEGFCFVPFSYALDENKGILLDVIGVRLVSAADRTFSDDSVYS